VREEKGRKWYYQYDALPPSEYVPTGHGSHTPVVLLNSKPAIHVPFVVAFDGQKVAPE
jgi:hypothetical protein